MMKSFLLFLIFTLTSCSLSKLYREPSGLEAKGFTQEKSSCLVILEAYISEAFQSKREKLLNLLKSQNEIQRNGTANAIESMFFIDYNYTLAELNKVTMNKRKLYNVDYPFAFNSGRISKRGKLYKKLDHFFSSNSKKPSYWKEQSFENYANARSYLMKESPPLSIQTMKLVHKKMMKGGVEELPSTMLGKFRKDSLIADETYVGLTKEQYKTIQSNPYLQFAITSRRKGRVQGTIIYPEPESLSDEVLKIVRAENPDLYNKVKEYRILSDSEKEKQHNAIQSSLVEVLVNERFLNFKSLKSTIGPINNTQSLDQFITLVTKFHRDIISIHPFQDGNGRTTREFILNYTLIKEGLPPPRLTNPDMDILSPLEEWKTQITNGMASTNALYDDITNRLRLNLSLNDSPELISPYIPRLSLINSKKYTSKKVSYGTRVAKIEPRQYAEFFDYLLEEDPSLIEKIEDNPSEVIKDISLKYLDLFKKNRIDFTHKKDGIKELNLRFVDKDFKSLFAQKTYKKKDLWDEKMKTWFTKDILWRGLAYAEKINEKEIINMFSRMHYHMASNSVAAYIDNKTTQSNYRELIFNDFKRYNDDLFHRKLTRMAKDHSEAGLLYGESYGYSTSKSRKVGKAFAMGAMQFSYYDKAGQEVYVEYGMQAKKEVVEALSESIQGRVLVGVRRSHKDVDLGRLKQLRPEFSYKYGRQQEVMGIGAADPDSIMTVQVLNPDGSIHLSYFRNPKKPSEIFILKDQEATNFEDITPQMILKKVIIK